MRPDDCFAWTMECYNGTKLIQILSTTTTTKTILLAKEIVDNVL